MVLKLPYKKLSLIVLGIFLLLFMAHRIAFFKVSIIERAASSIVYPFLVVQKSVMQPVKSYFETRKSVQELEDKIALLQSERDDALAKNVELQSIITYAQDTKELIDFKQRYNFQKAILADVLVKNFSDQAHFFLIDKGASAGIETDMVAIYKDCLIGRVTEVYPRYSKIQLLSDQNCKVAAFCAQSKATGIYQGINKEWSATLGHISHLCALEIGEMILSSGDGLIFPRGFALGKIRSYTTEGLFHLVQIEPLVDLHAIGNCYVVHKGTLSAENDVKLEVILS